MRAFYHSLTNPLKALFWMLGTVTASVSMALSARQLSTELGLWQILTLRSMVGLLVLLLVISMLGWHRIQVQRWRWHWARNLSHFAGQAGWFYALGILPLAAVSALEFTSPIWTVFFAALLLQERISWVRLAGLALAFVGVLLIIRPGTQTIQPAALVMLASAFIYGFSHVTTKKLTPVNNGLTIVLLMLLIQLPLGLLPALYVGWVWPSLSAWPWIVLVGLGGLAAHLCIVKALQYADISFVVPLEFLRLPLIALFGYLLYQERIDLWFVLGAVAIFVANLMNIRSGLKHHRQQTAACVVAPLALIESGPATSEP